MKPSSPCLIRSLQSMHKYNPVVASLVQCSEDTNKYGQWQMLFTATRSPSFPIFCYYLGFTWAKKCSVFNPGLPTQALEVSSARTKLMPCRIILMKQGIGISLIHYATDEDPHWNGTHKQHLSNGQMGCNGDPSLLLQVDAAPISECFLPRPPPGLDGAFWMCAMLWVSATEGAVFWVHRAVQQSRALKVCVPRCKSALDCLLYPEKLIPIQRISKTHHLNSN